MIRKGREHYSKNYEEAVRLYNKGLAVREIAERLRISYSAAYHWVKGLRKPESGNVNAFADYLRSHGPAAVVDIKQGFAKHNELFLIAARRGLPVRRFMMKKKFGEYSTWYYLEGQEHELEERTNELMQKVRAVAEKLSSHG